MERKRCFDPVVDERTRLLVLGSLPGEQSLVLQQYYGNRQNKFWELVGQVINVDLRAMAYEARLAALREHGTAVSASATTTTCSACLLAIPISRLLHLMVALRGD
jgi:hypoxanthine-DNA glycosylase